MLELKFVAIRPRILTDLLVENLEWNVHHYIRNLETVVLLWIVSEKFGSKIATKEG